MDAKDLRTESSMSERSNDGNTKYTQASTVLQCNRKNPYQDIGSNSLGKVEVQTARPCAVIGPDRIVPQPVSSDAYMKKSSMEPWAGDNIYRQPPEYPHKMSEFHLPTRNISPRQTFQENMQRIMVPPLYNATKLKEDHNFPVDANVSSLRNTKTNMPTEAKYCDVPYTVNPIISDQKTVRNSDASVSNINAALPRNVPHAWPPSSATIRPPKPYGAPEMYSYVEYPSCGGPRPMVMPRSQRTIHEDSSQVYSDPFYHESNLRFKPYPPVKERYPHARYDYIGNYSAPFHPSHLPPHKYDLQKTIPSHPYSGYPQVPLKYLDSRIPEQFMNGYQRPLNPQHNFNAVPFRNQIMHPGYGPVASNYLQTNKYFPYATDSSVKSMTTNKLPYDTAHKMYAEYENSRAKPYGMTENFYANEMGRQVMKGQVLPPSYPSVNIHPLPPHPYYRKENMPFKQYDYNQQFRNIDQSININGATISRLPSQFSPGNIAISPSDSNTSNETSHTQGTLPEDCGYVSQSSTASIRSMESSITRIPSDPYKRFDYRYGPMARTSPLLTKLENHSKNKKGIDVRQFLQMWNEGEEENSENTTKDVSVKSANANEITNYFDKTNESQLYVLGLVNVPSEELSKYEHIQKISKLPENIKGYNSIELLNQFEEAIESSNLNNCNYKPHTSRDYVHLKTQSTIHSLGIPSRPLSPLDVEAKISQSVIHKEVGCNFEIKPCSPKILNVDVPRPVQILNERSIEKVSNHLMITSPQISNVNDNAINCSVISNQEHIMSKEHVKVPSCKMINTKYDSLHSEKSDYSLQDLESSSGVCLASLPRLDNDIELNFPEVNQQFINANKVESVITTTPVDLPTLELDQSVVGPDNKGKKLEDKIEGEKVLTKLSKYRKQKRKDSECAENQSEAKTQALRTDSVIIKNPENKNHEDNFKDFTNMSSELPPINDPINLAIKTENGSKIEYAQTDCYENTSNDLAINFSLNSNINSVLSDFTDPNKTNICSPKNYESTNLVANANMQEKNNSDMFIDNDIFSFSNSDAGFISCPNSCKNSDKEETLSKETLSEDTNVSSNNSISNEIENNKISLENNQNIAVKHDQHDNQIYNQILEINAGPSIKDFKKSLRQEEMQVEETKNYNHDFEKKYEECNKNSLKNYTPVRKELFSPYIQNLALFSVGLCSNSAQTFDVKSDYHKTDKPLGELNLNTKVELLNVDHTKTDEKAVVATDINEDKNINTDGTVDVNIHDINNIHSPQICQDHSNEEIVKEKEVSMPNSDIDEKDISTETIEPFRVLDTNSKNDQQENVTESESVVTSHDFDVKEKETSSDTYDSLNLLDQNNHDAPRQTSNEKINQENIIVSHNSDIDENYGGDETNGFLSTLDVNNITKLKEVSNEDINNGKPAMMNSSEINETDTTNLKKHMCSKSSERLNTKVLVDYSDCEDDDSEDEVSSLEDEKITQQCFDDNEYRTENLPETKKNIESRSTIEHKTTNYNPDDNTEHVQSISDTEKYQDSEVIARAADLFVPDKALNIKDKKDNATPVTVDRICDASGEGQNMYVNNEDSKDFNEENISKDNNSNALRETNNEIMISETKNYDSEYSKYDSYINSPIQVKTDTNAINELNEISSNEKSIIETEEGSIEENKQSGTGSANHKLICNYKMKSPNMETITEKHEQAQIHNTIINETETNDYYLQMEISHEINFPKENHVMVNRKRSLKRSLSDSALNSRRNISRTNYVQDCPADESLWPAKRKRLHFQNFGETELIVNHLAHRRNSISSFFDEENVSFCILIDNDCLITEDESIHEKNCYTEITDDCISSVETDITQDYKSIENEDEVLGSAGFNLDSINKSFVLGSVDEDKSFEDVWVQDVACVETVITDDVAEDVELSAVSSPKSIDTICEESNNNESNLFDVNDHSDKVKYIYGSEMCSSDAQLVETLHRTPQMDVNALIHRESCFIDDGTCYDNESLENILSDYNNDTNKTNDQETSEMPLFHPHLENLTIISNSASLNSSLSNSLLLTQDDTVHSCESSSDNVFAYEGQPEENTNHTVSNSPEVSSTTSEEKNSTILLKITNYGGSRIAQINETHSNKKHNTVCCKYTETKDYISTDNNLPTRPLITKAAQKYIPPIKETIRDLKVRLPLPPQSLIKLKQLKMSKEKPKPNVNKNNLSILRNEVPKKSKPKFEDVLKSIDEIHIKNYKEKSKKVKKVIPKVVIKKNENGSHYASTSKLDKYNPDLTGMKWQPWVFLDKNYFIDKMALRKKSRAIFSHRKNTYVFAETFKKYKSTSSNTRFVISQPEVNDSSTGKLKYTIRLSTVTK